MCAPHTLIFSSPCLAGTQTVLDAEVTEGILLFAYKSFLLDSVILKGTSKVFLLESLFVGCIITVQ